MDPNSYANVHEYKVILLDWIVHKIDWQREVLQCTATLSIQSQVDNAPNLVLDTWGLDIASITYAGQKLTYNIAPHDEKFGSAMTIKLPTEIAHSGQKFDVAIDYETTSRGSAIQFLKPEQTMGKKFPYIFTQCQAIAARSLVPCQDTPSVKFPYTATVHSDLQVVMSALLESFEALDGQTKVLNEITTLCSLY